MKNPTASCGADQRSPAKASHMEGKQTLFPIVNVEGLYPRRWPCRNRVGIITRRAQGISQPVTLLMEP
jgi:hypothetical protein